MVEIVMWLLLTTSTGATNRTEVLERFRTKEACEYVRGNLVEKSRYFPDKCIQANILVTK